MSDAWNPRVLVPLNAGVYETRHHGDKETAYQFWTGEYWCMPLRNMADARANSCKAYVQNVEFRPIQDQAGRRMYGPKPERILLGCQTTGQCFCTGRCKRTAEEQAAHEAAVLALNERTATMPLGRTVFEPKPGHGPAPENVHATLADIAGLPAASALDTQVGGDHYKKLRIQPMEYSMANGLDACQHTIVKYVTRFRDKGGIADLEKARHCIDMLIEFEQRGAE